MKRLLLVLGVCILVLSGCAKTQYIEILEQDKIWYGGEVDLKVDPGDTLQILLTKTCRGGKGTCYKVKDLATGKTGFVNKKRMEERHRIYTEEE